MSLGIVLDVAIGLAFTYLLLSIMVSGLQEIFTNFISLRGKKLRSGIAACPSAARQRDQSGRQHPLDRCRGARA